MSASVRTIVLLLEEESAKTMLQKFLPRYFSEGDVSFIYVSFEGKQDLLREVERKIKYWLTPNTAFLVLLDQDGSDCIPLKQRVLESCIRATTDSKAPFRVRIACHELENWYLGDLTSLQQVFGGSIDTRNNRRKYDRDPDHFANAPDEVRHLTRDRYRKVRSAAEMGKQIDPERNVSKSFQNFFSAINLLLGDLT